VEKKAEAYRKEHDTLGKLMPIWQRISVFRGVPEVVANELNHSDRLLLSLSED
jgi:hypothetical protein